MFGNNVRETTATTGAGQITLAGAVSGHLPFSQQIADGQPVDFIVQDGNDLEFSRGRFTSPNKLDRGFIYEKQVGGVVTNMPATGLDLSGSAEVFIGPSAYRSHSGYFGAPLADFYRVGHNIIALDATHNPGGSGIPAADQLATGAYYFAAPTRVGEIGVRITTAAAGGNVRFGLYRLDNAMLDRSAALIIDSGAYPTDATGFHFVSVSDQLLYGWYAVAALFDNTAARIAGSVSQTPFGLFGAARWDNLRCQGVFFTNITGGLPTTLDFTTYHARVTNGVPGIMFR